MHFEFVTDMNQRLSGIIISSSICISTKIQAAVSSVSVSVNMLQNSDNRKAEKLYKKIRAEFRVLEAGDIPAILTTLQKRGVISVYLLGPYGVNALNKLFIEYMKNAPEYSQAFRDDLFTPEYRKRRVYDRRFQAGGFGALNNPSASHNLFNRLLETAIHDSLFELFRQMAGTDKFTEFLPDRLSFRPRGDSPGAESVHRDISSFLLPADIFFGSILNLNIAATGPGAPSSSQFFSCQPGSQLTDHVGGPNQRGFVTSISDAEKKEFQEKKMAIEIKSGHILIFFENILHEVNPTKMTVDQFRKYFGIRVTASPNGLYPQNARFFEDQETLIHKGGVRQESMVPKLYLVNHLPMCQDFTARRFDDTRLIINHAVRSGKRTGQVFKVVAKLLPGLVSLGVSYPPYTAEELQKFKPTNLNDVWIKRNAQKDGSGGLKRKFV